MTFNFILMRVDFFSKKFVGVKYFIVYLTTQIRNVLIKQNKNITLDLHGLNCDGERLIEGQGCRVFGSLFLFCNQQQANDQAETRLHEPNVYSQKKPLFPEALRYDLTIFISFFRVLAVILCATISTYLFSCRYR